MKNKRLIIMLVLVMVLITGCQKENTSDKSNSSGNKPNTTVDTSKIDTIDEYKYYTTLKCEALSEEIRYFEDDWFVTKNNDIYVYNTEGLYSDNDANCKKLELKFPENITFVDRKNMIYLTSDNKFVSVYSKTEKLQVTSGYYGERDYHRWVPNKLYKSGYTKVHFLYDALYDISRFYTLTTKGDNHIYLVKSDFNMGLGKEEDGYIELTEDATIVEEEIVFTLPDDEKIIDFYYDTTDFCISKSCPKTNSQYIEPTTGKEYGIPENRPELYVLTEKNYYRIMLANEDCKKYVDVECRYEWKKDEAINQIRNEMLYRDDTTLITKDGRVYSTIYID